VGKYLGENKYSIGNVFLKASFIQKPRLYYEYGFIKWNMGGAYIGEPSRLTLTISIDETSESFSLDPYSPDIFEFGDRTLGEYSFEITKKNKNLFSKEKKTVIYSGLCMLGDPNMLRFKDSRICIPEIIDAANNNIVTIKKCYIDHIEFVEITDCSEGICPIYTGVLYTYTKDNKRHSFSSEERLTPKGNSILAVNPVKIIYISDDCLCVSDSSGDPLYFFHKFNYELDRQENFITEIEPTKQNEKTYSSVDLVHYKKETRKRV
jgi:hypothetical protein